MKKPAFLKQKNMVRVLYALAPVALVSIYYFGWRIIFVLLVSVVAAFFSEWIMAEKRNGKVSFACFVTASLYALSLPPTTPYWIAAVGAVFAILFGKEAFGGFGKNVFNPAIVGRAFIYVCFPVEQTSRFVPSFSSFPGGFTRYSLAALPTAPDFIAKAGLGIPDAVTAATPMWARRDFGFVTDITSLLTGHIRAVFESGGTQRVLAAGSTGEVCAAVLLLSGAYLVATKTAQWRLIVATLAGTTLCNIFLRNILDIDIVPSLPFTLLSGGLMYAAIFMVTDPVSAPKQNLSQWIYGVFIGAMIVFFRYRAIFAGGVAFSILLGNSLAPSLDFWLKRIRERTKEPKKA